MIERFMRRINDIVLMGCGSRLLHRGAFLESIENEYVLLIYQTNQARLGNRVHIRATAMVPQVVAITVVTNMEG